MPQMSVVFFTLTEYTEIMEALCLCVVVRISLTDYADGTDVFCFSLTECTEITEA